MKRKFYGSILLFTLLFVLVSQAAALSRPVRRIKFARHATKTSVTGNLNNYKDKQIYLLRVREGQTLETMQLRSENSSHYITVHVKDPSGAGVGDSDASCNSRREITPTTAGDYTIEVVECQKADPWRGRFTLQVRVK